MIFLTFFIVCAASCQADINITDYLYWSKADIYQVHQFFPTRSLEEERVTNQAASATVDSLLSNLTDGLSKILAFQYRELDTAKQLMGGTDAEGCINGISNFLDKAISDVVEDYENCAADASLRLSRIYNYYVKVNASYYASYQRSLAGMDACAKTYPNKDSVDRLKSCFESMTKNYFLAVNNTQSSLFPSPSMSYFQNTVVQCASIAAQSVAAKGAQFLKMLVNCAALSGTVDPTSYADELSAWQGYSDSLNSQVQIAQQENYDQVWAVERDMRAYYNLKKQALEKYVIESRGFSTYLNKIYTHFSDYYNTITATSLDNPAGSDCVNDARTALDDVCSTGASKSLDCDNVIVSDTKSKLEEIYSNFISINNIMPSIGNKAILDCFAKGYIFAPNTIYECFRQTSKDFENDYTDSFISSSKDLVILGNYISSFYDSTELPCGGTSVARMNLAAQTALYNLQRCLYISFGTTYEVTTPYSSTVSSTYAYTTTEASNTTYTYPS